MEEARVKYSEALKIREKDNPIIYDVCFGMGYNTLAAIRYLQDRPARFFLFENDEHLLDSLKEFDSGLDGFEVIEKIVSEKQVEFANKYFELLVGDFRKKIGEVRKGADFVFFDPFSPKKAPGLWTVEVFKSLYQSMNRNGKLATYSYARKTRENLEAAGFTLYDGPVLGRRSPSLIAVKQD